MPTVGEQLRAAREQQGVTVEQVAESTNQRADHIRALEAGDHGVFAAPVYVKGSVRTYAKLLKLDPAPLILELEKEIQGEKRFQESSSFSPGPPDPVSRILFYLSQVNWKVTLVLLAVVAVTWGGVAGYRSYLRKKTEASRIEMGPGLYTPSNRISGETLPLPPIPAPR